MLLCFTHHVVANELKESSYLALLPLLQKPCRYMLPSTKLQSPIKRSSCSPSNPEKVHQINPMMNYTKAPSFLAANWAKTQNRNPRKALYWLKSIQSFKVSVPTETKEEREGTSRETREERERVTRITNQFASLLIDPRG